MGPVTLDIADGVATLTLQRPQVCNALDADAIRETNVLLDRTVEPCFATEQAR